MDFLKFIAGMVIIGFCTVAVGGIGCMLGAAIEEPSAFVAVGAIGGGIGGWFIGRWLVYKIFK
ncbi:MAG: hypothetical protein FWF53_10415 [Candidatus Azobacteroides sp.]|nr:hypothetical protein [Candidatus Azobacteroides sp.]